LDEAFKAMIPSMIAEKTISCITSVADFISLLRPDDSAGAPSYSLEPEVGRSDGRAAGVRRVVLQTWT
jgi:hypothetical protein